MNLKLILKVPYILFIIVCLVCKVVCIVENSKIGVVISVIAVIINVNILITENEKDGN